ncbi:piggyBac transposable element-derived protein 4-like [Saccostrea cucullata]|uniref:piggyBac transposable element-derived protein 4-like n=1 Tax=Saccostrea cuccullata TaxID=36930 RepID=UPI002ED5FFCE
MEVVDDVVEGNAVLDQVDPENRDLFREIFLNENSDDEFVGFDAEDLENDEGTVEFEDKWIQDDLIVHAPVFRGEKKINVDLDDDCEMIDFFKLIVTEQFLEEVLVQETNKYAADFFNSPQGRNLKPQSRFRKWSDVDLDNMKRFIAIVIGMGLVQHQDLQDYWSTDEMLRTPFFGNTMTKNRFLMIMSLFHLNNNDNHVPRGQDGHDPIFKVRRAYDHFRLKFEDLYSPGENIAIDEGMIAWRGNYSFRVYMPDKPDKFGVKLFMLCDSSNGYCSRFEMYHGTQENVSNKGKIYDLVMRLMNPYLGKGHKLYVDNFYTSPILFHDLFQRRTGACGTMRVNRKGVPADLKTVKLKKGESVAMTNWTLQLLNCKRDVHMCTTVHNAEFINVPGRVDRTTGQPIQHPRCIVDYDKYMGAVDRCDQIIAYPAFKRRTLKWWIKGETTPQPTVVRGAANPRDVERLTGRHFLSKIAQKEGQKSKPLRTCPVCSTTTGKRKTVGDGRKTVRSTYECKVCDFGLCVHPCFMLNHTKKDYKQAHQRLQDQNETVVTQTKLNIL